MTANIRCEMLDVRNNVVSSGNRMQIDTHVRMFEEVKGEPGWQQVNSENNNYLTVGFAQVVHLENFVPRWFPFEDLEEIQGFIKYSNEEVP